jgi:prepilin-type N-terminal cleavage/methylation domain-containing protein
MTVLRREDGFTLTELLVGMSLMLIVMSASLGLLDQFTAISKRTDRAVDVQDSARAASRQLARSLRNLAASPDAPGVVERARPYDIVFRAVDKPRADAAANTRNLRRTRYCLDAADPDRGRLIEQTQRWSSAIAPPVPAATACPGGGWQGTRLAADGLTNRAGGLDRPLWTYGETTGGQPSSVKLNLFMNSDPRGRAREVALQTGVFLRNQNRAPSASFVATLVGVRHVLLNGSASSDPEGQPLEFHWYANGVKIGQGRLLDYQPTNAGTQVIGLEVFDSSGLSARSAPQSVVVE